MQKLIKNFFKDTLGHKDTKWGRQAGGKHMNLAEC